MTEVHPKPNSSEQSFAVQPQAIGPNLLGQMQTYCCKAHAVDLLRPAYGFDKICRLIAAVTR